MAYFKLADALKEVKDASGGANTALAGLKLVGKTIFNTGKFVSEAAVEHTERSSAKLLQRDGLTPEQKDGLQELHGRARTMRIKNDIGALQDELRLLELRRSDEEARQKFCSADTSIEIDQLLSRISHLEDELARQSD